MGCHHTKPKRPRCARGRRPRARICLRKGCGCKYQPRCWNQRYCQEPDCRREVQRWQAARRQARRRQDDAVKTQHAQAQRARRQRTPSLPQTPANPEVVAARGHAAKPFLPTPFCDRPGCYEPPLKSGRNQARYCCCACRQAVRRVLDGNASGGTAALYQVAGHAPRSMRPPARGGPDSSALTPA